MERAPTTRRRRPTGWAMGRIVHTAAGRRRSFRIAGRLPRPQPRADQAAGVIANFGEGIRSPFVAVEYSAGRSGDRPSIDLARLQPRQVRRVRQPRPCDASIDPRRFWRAPRPSTCLAKGVWGRVPASDRVTRDPTAATLAGGGNGNEKG